MKDTPCLFTKTASGWIWCSHRHGRLTLCITFITISIIQDLYYSTTGVDWIKMQDIPMLGHYASSMVLAWQPIYPKGTRVETLYTASSASLILVGMSLLHYDYSNSRLQLTRRTMSCSCHMTHHHTTCHGDLCWVFLEHVLEGYHHVC